MWYRGINLQFRYVGKSIEAAITVNGIDTLMMIIIIIIIWSRKALHTQYYNNHTTYHTYPDKHILSVKNLLLIHLSSWSVIILVATFANLKTINDFVINHPLSTRQIWARIKNFSGSQLSTKLTHLRRDPPLHFAPDKCFDELGSTFVFRPRAVERKKQALSYYCHDKSFVAYVSFMWSR